MYIEKLRMKNFKGTSGKWTEIDIGSNGTTLIQGANGSGKSTMFHAITFGLFGKNSHTKGSSKSSIPVTELVNDINKNDMCVEIYLPNYIIKRTVKDLEIIDKKDGKNLADKSSKTIDQKYLEDNILNGLNYDIYTKIVFLNSKATSTPFLYMTPTQRKDFIEYILDLRLVYFVGEALKSKISDAKLDIRDSESKLSNAKNLVESEEYKIEQDKLKLEDQKEKVEKLKAQQQSMIDDIDKDIAERDKTIEEISSKWLNFDVETEIQKSEKLDNEADEIYMVTIPKYNEAITKLKNALTKMSLERDTYNKNKEGFKLCGDCPTVSKIIGDFDEKAYDDKVIVIDGKIKELSTKTDELSEKAEDIRLKRDAIDKEVDKYNQDQKEIKNLKFRNTEDEAKKVKLSKLDSIELFEIDYTRLEDLKKNQSQTVITHDKNINALEQLERIKKRVGDKSIKTEILEYYSPLLEDKINELLEKFFEDDDFSFNLEIDESFNIEGYKNGKKTNIFKLSEGQLSSVSLAITLAFQYLLSLKNSIDFKLFMVDEILDIALDSSRLDKIVQYMVEISKEKAVMIISHNATLNVEYFDRVINTKKVNKFSEYVVS